MVILFVKTLCVCGDSICWPFLSGPCPSEPCLSDDVWTLSVLKGRTWLTPWSDFGRKMNFFFCGGGPLMDIRKAFDPPGIGSRQALARLSLAEKEDAQGEEEEEVFSLYKNIMQTKSRQSIEQRKTVSNASAPHFPFPDLSNRLQGYLFLLNSFFESKVGKSCDRGQYFRGNHF